MGRSGWAAVFKQSFKYAYIIFIKLKKKNSMLSYNGELKNFDITNIVKCYTAIKYHITKHLHPKKRMFMIYCWEENNSRIQQSILYNSNMDMHRHTQWIAAIDTKQIVSILKQLLVQYGGTHKRGQLWYDVFSHKMQGFSDLSMHQNNLEGLVQQTSGFH